MCGNRPRFADVEPGTLTLSGGTVRGHLTKNVRAILAVDADGVPCDMTSLRRIADEAGVWLVIDAAQSLGARIGEGRASRLADAVVVSFTSRKSVCAGEGGAVLTANRELYERLVWWTQHPFRQRRAVDHEAQLGVERGRARIEIEGADEDPRFVDREGLCMQAGGGRTAQRGPFPVAPDARRQPPQFI